MHYRASLVSSQTFQFTSNLVRLRMSCSSVNALPNTCTNYSKQAAKSRKRAAQVTQISAPVACDVAPLSRDFKSLTWQPFCMTWEAI